MSDAETMVPAGSAEVGVALRHDRVLPVIVLDHAPDAAPLARALLEGGLRCAEVTLRTPAALDGVRRMADAAPELLVGVGTVLTPRAAEEACTAGARFIVSPGFNPAVVEHCLGQGIPVYPGVCTPSEIERALEWGLRTLKFFPAEAAGGVPFLRALAAPYPMVDFLPTGGVTVRTLGGYLALPNVLACGGSWMVAREWIEKGDFDQIRAETRNAVAVVDFHRAGAR